MRNSILALVELQPNVPTAEWFRIGVVEYDFAVQFDEEVPAVGGDIEGLPVVAIVLALGLSCV